MNRPLPSEVWYQWKELAHVDGEIRYLTPWSDPALYEYPMDLLFGSAEDAVDYVVEQELAEAGEWILVKVTFEPVHPKEGE